jgi:hypothetical protein
MAFLWSPVPVTSQDHVAGRARKRNSRLPIAGTLLTTRQFENRKIVVKVLEDGFEYQSQQYRSLSAIAREVTGTRWNGLRFFGLAERRDG